LHHRQEKKQKDPDLEQSIEPRRKRLVLCSATPPSPDVKA